MTLISRGLRRCESLLATGLAATVIAAPPALAGEIDPDGVIEAGREAKEAAEESAAHWRQWGEETLSQTGEDAGRLADEWVGQLGGDPIQVGEAQPYECAGSPQCLIVRGTGKWGNPFGGSGYLELYARPIEHKAGYGTQIHNWSFSAGGIRPDDFFCSGKTDSVFDSSYSYGPTSAIMVFAPDDAHAIIEINGRAFNSCSETIQPYVLQAELMAPLPGTKHVGVSVGTSPPGCPVSYTHARRGNLSSASFRWYGEAFGEGTTAFSPATNTETKIEREFQSAAACV